MCVGGVEWLKKAACFACTVQAATDRCVSTQPARCPHPSRAAVLDRRQRGSGEGAAVLGPGGGPVAGVGEGEGGGEPTPSNTLACRPPSVRGAAAATAPANGLAGGEAPRAGVAAPAAVAMPRSKLAANLRGDAQKAGGRVVKGPAGGVATAVGTRGAGGGGGGGAWWMVGAAGEERQRADRGACTHGAHSCGRCQRSPQSSSAWGQVSGIRKELGVHEGWAVFLGERVYEQQQLLPRAPAPAPPPTDPDPWQPSPPLPPPGPHGRRASAAT